VTCPVGQLQVEVSSGLHCEQPLVKGLRIRQPFLQPCAVRVRPVVYVGSSRTVRLESGLRVLSNANLVSVRLPRQASLPCNGCTASRTSSNTDITLRCALIIIAFPQLQAHHSVSLWDTGAVCATFKLCNRSVSLVNASLHEVFTFTSNRFCKVFPVLHNSCKSPTSNVNCVVKCMQSSCRGCVVVTSKPAQVNNARNLHGH
jgi:hypothetical protein